MNFYRLEREGDVFMLPRLKANGRAFRHFKPGVMAPRLLRTYVRTRMETGTRLSVMARARLSASPLLCNLSLAITPVTFPGWLAAMVEQWRVSSAQQRNGRRRLLWGSSANKPSSAAMERASGKTGSAVVLNEIKSLWLQPSRVGIVTGTPSVLLLQRRSTSRQRHGNSGHSNRGSGGGTLANGTEQTETLGGFSKRLFPPFLHTERTRHCHCHCS